MKHKKICVLLIFLTVIITLIIGINSLSWLTYVEYAFQNEGEDGYICLDATGQEIIQDFQSPYNIIHGISVKLTTFGHDNNSLWVISIRDEESGNTIASKEFNGSLLSDNVFNLIRFDNNIRVDTQKTYQICITAKKVQKETALAFYRLSEAADTDRSLYINGDYYQGMLTCAIFGSDTNYWWLRFVVLVGIIILLVLLRWFVIGTEKLKDDLVFMSMIVMCIVMILLISFCDRGRFLDELDNMHGGMIIKNGGVIYKDYISQHTPVLYYLCGVFAIFGAGSVAQFRLSYYLFIAAVWGFLYYRHSKHFGKKTMLFLPVAECVLTITIAMPEGAQVLSDCLQGICMTALLLEFLRYYMDRQLNWSRCIIVSLCFWGSIGVAFISAYAIIWIIIAFIGAEIQTITKTPKTKNNNKQFLARYSRFLLTMLIPLVCAVIYFYFNNALGRAYNQSYELNRKVYPLYYGMGDNLFQPVIDGIRNHFNYITSNIQLIFQAKATIVNILQLGIAGMSTVALIVLACQGRPVEAITLFLAMCCSGSRGTNFHALPAWYIAIMIMIVFRGTFRRIYDHKAWIPIIAISVVFMFGTFINTAGANLLTKQGTVNTLESEVIRRTEEGEKIFVDSVSCDSLYFMYKKRNPVNTAHYLVPWIMDWYEQDTVDELKQEQPRIVVYAENSNIWGHTYFNNLLLAEISSNYARLSDDPDVWGYKLWIRKDNNADIVD